MPGGEPATASTHRDRGTLLNGEINARQAGSQTTAGTGSEFPQFEN